MLKRFKAFLDERIGLSHLTSAFLDAPLPGGARWMHTFGAALLALFFIEFATGLALATVYSPSTVTAWSSVYYIQHHFHWGPFIRGVHFWAAQTMILVCGLHLALVIIAGAYKRPREFSWWIGLLLLGVTLAFAHTGSLLPWDQRAYWTTRVEGNITAGVPIVGLTSQHLIQGGAELGTLALSRLYSAHVGLLPLLALLVIVAHVGLMRKHMATEAAASSVDEQKSFARFWPDQAWRDAVTSLLVVLVVVFIARKYAAPLDAPADPQSQYNARPEWYLLALFKLRKSFEGPKELIATMVIPGAISTVFIALPLIDRAQGFKKRAPVLSLALALMALVGGYTVWSMMADVRDPHYQQDRERADRQAERAFQLAHAGIPPEGPLEMVRNDPVARPQELFAQHCGNCHAPQSDHAFDSHNHRTAARGPTLEGFGSRGWATAMMNDPQGDSLFHRTEIDDMPSQARRPGVDVAAIAEYLYSQSVEPGDTPANPELAQHGGELYHSKCTQCHQGAGDLSETDAADRDAPDLTGWGTRAWIRAQITHPAAPERYGAHNHMPEFSDELQGRELEWVVDYVRGMRLQNAPVFAAPPPHDAP